jgi:methyl-accepting chemotaxis protein-1 (serine sensor receptor)
MNAQALTVKQRLYGLMTAFSLILALVGGAGLAGLAQSNRALQHVYEGRTKALERISTAQDLIVQSHFALSDAVLDPSAQKTTATIELVARNIGEINRMLAEYSAYPLDPNERKLADGLGADWAKLRDKGFQPTADLLKANNLSEAQWVVTQTIEPTVAQVKAEAAHLRQLQIDEGQDDYQRSVAREGQVVALVGGAVVLGIALCSVLCWIIARTLYRQLGGEPAYAAQIANRIAEGNLAVAVVSRSDDHTSILHAMSVMRDKLATMIGEIQRAAETIGSATAEITAGNMDLSQRTEEHASGIQRTAASMEQLAGTVKQNADHAHQATALAARASDKASEGNRAVQEAIGRMASLSTHSVKIRDITSVIEGIAFQTNILALNAAVEAARAGEQGRGFAVVASEVRSLAQRSAAAAKEISALISTTTAEVDMGAQTVQSAGATIQEMLSAVSSVASLVDGIAHASSQQSSGIDEINRAVSLMDQSTQQNAALVEEAAASAGALQQQAETLRDTVSVFKLDGNADAWAASAPTDLRPGMASAYRRPAAA